MNMIEVMRATGQMLEKILEAIETLICLMCVCVCRKNMV